MCRRGRIFAEICFFGAGGGGVMMDGSLCIVVRSRFWDVIITGKIAISPFEDIES